MLKIISCIFILVIFTNCISGCASIGSVHVGNYAVTSKLNPGGTAYVVVPADGQYGPKTCIDSGQAVAQCITSSFSKYLERVETYDKEELEEAMLKAKASNFSYLIDSAIINWADHVTEWHGKRDRAEVKVNIYDVNSGEILASDIVKGIGTWFTFGGYHPQHILQKSMDKYASSIFGNK